MTLEQQVVSLEIAKTLKELGVKQESIYDWRVPKSGTIPEGQLMPSEGEAITKKHNPQFFEWHSAFTVAELGEMLLADYLWNVQKIPSGAFLATSHETGAGEIARVHTEADARGKMLIYLLENKLITL